MYLIMGIAYRRIMTGAQGIEQIPHYYFWRDLGNLQAVSIVMSELSNLSIVMSELSNLAPCFLTLLSFLYLMSKFFCFLSYSLHHKYYFFCTKTIYTDSTRKFFFNIGYYTLLLKHDLGWVYENAYSISCSSNILKCFYVQQSKLL